MGLSNRTTPRHPPDGVMPFQPVIRSPVKSDGLFLNPLPPIGDLVGLTTLFLNFFFFFFFLIHLLCGQYTSFQHDIILD